MYVCLQHGKYSSFPVTRTHGTSHQTTHARRLPLLGYCPVLLSFYSLGPVFLLAAIKLLKKKIALAHDSCFSGGIILDSVALYLVVDTADVCRGGLTI